MTPDGDLARVSDPSTILLGAVDEALEALLSSCGALLAHESPNLLAEVGDAVAEIFGRMKLVAPRGMAGDTTLLDHGDEALDVGEIVVVVAPRVGLFRVDEIAVELGAEPVLLVGEGVGVEDADFRIADGGRAEQPGPSVLFLAIAPVVILVVEEVAEAQGDEHDIRVPRVELELADHAALHRELSDGIGDALVDDDVSSVCEDRALGEDDGAIVFDVDHRSEEKTLELPDDAARDGDRAHLVVVAVEQRVGAVGDRLHLRIGDERDGDGAVGGHVNLEGRNFVELEDIGSHCDAFVPKNRNP